MNKIKRKYCRGLKMAKLIFMVKIFGSSLLFSFYATGFLNFNTIWAQPAITSKKITLQSINEKIKKNKIKI